MLRVIWESARRKTDDIGDHRADDATPQAADKSEAASGGVITFSASPTMKLIVIIFANSQLINFNTPRSFAVTTWTPSKLGYVLAGGAIAAAGFFFGSSQTTPLHAQQDGAAHAQGGAFGVSIPNGGSALVKGKDGFAYIVDSRGVYVRAAQSGKGLELP